MKIVNKYLETNLVLKMVIGLIIGIGLGLLHKSGILNLKFIAILGDLFIQALKGIAPVLVLFLVVTSICNRKQENVKGLKKVIMLYLLGSFIAAFCAVIISFIFPVNIPLATMAEAPANNGDLYSVINNVLISIVANPIQALVDGNFLSVLFWGVLLGIALHKANQATKLVLEDVTNGITSLVKWIINFAPFGILGIVFKTVSEFGAQGLMSYLNLIGVLLLTMAVMVFIVNPLITFVMIRKNPFPLIFKTLKTSGVTAFFTRSSAANIPVNLELCEELKLDPDMYSVSIPLGATINMGGAAITITILTLAAAHSLGLQVSFPTAMILSVIATISACGSSGVAGGSLLLIPIACSLFGIDPATSAAVMGVGFTISVIQDSCETAINSSTDVLYTAIADMSSRKRK